jgi:hypothetical protein
VTKEEKTLRDQIRVAVPNPVMRRSVLLKVGKALRASIKEYEDAEGWLKKRKDLLAIHPYGEDGFALDFGNGTSAEVAYPTIPAAVAAAIREKK